MLQVELAPPAPILRGVLHQRVCVEASLSLAVCELGEGQDRVLSSSYHLCLAHISYLLNERRENKMIQKWSQYSRSLNKSLFL